VRKLASTDLGLSQPVCRTTSGTKEKPVGTVYIALADAKQTIWPITACAGRIRNKHGLFRNGFV